MGKRRRQRRERERSQEKEAAARPQTHPEKRPQTHPEKRPQTRAEEPAVLEKEAITPLGKKTIGAGIIVLAVGFYILTLTDPNGRNWASLLSPLLILGAYAIIAIGIFLPQKGFLKPETTKEGDAETSQLS